MRFLCRSWILAGAVIAAMGGAAHAQTPSANAQQMADDVCAVCHGPKGESRTSSAFPRLAGQRAEYLERQLRAFRDRSRNDPMAQAFMWGPTVKLSNAQIAQLAAYYAAQTSVQGGSADPTLVQAGEALFVHGMANSGVAPCITCHGPDAQGKEAIPSLAGQHAEYLVKQLGLFKTELRTSADAALMHASVAGMTFEQMVEVAAYLSSR